MLRSTTPPLPQPAIPGLPLLGGLVGVAGYVLLLVLSLIRHPLARSLSFGGAVIAVIFSAYLTYLELHVIEAICQWCVGSAVIAALLLVVHGAWAYRDV